MTDTTRPAPTPENTPLPGGGSWRWSDDIPGWLPADEPATAAIEPESTPRKARAIPMKSEA